MRGDVQYAGVCQKSWEDTRGERERDQLKLQGVGVLEFIHEDVCVHLDTYIARSGDASKRSVFTPYNRPKKTYLVSQINIYMISKENKPC